MHFIEYLSRPWPWYITGPLIGLTVPALLVMGNKSFGVSSSLRHVCAAIFPANISYFKYDWRKESWNLWFVMGILLGGLVSVTIFKNPEPMHLNPKLVQELSGYGIHDYAGLLPADLFSWHALLTPRGWVLMVLGGFLVGFGTRYAGGCTSGHSIMGLSNLQWPSLVATCCFHLFYNFDKK